MPLHCAGLPFFGAIPAAADDTSYCFDSRVAVVVGDVLCDGRRGIVHVDSLRLERPSTARAPVPIRPRFGEALIRLRYVVY
jgi:hypothetical protein